jgi:hypothetical protein
VAGICYALLGFAPSLWFPATVVVLAHTFGSILWVSSNVLLQIAVPDSFRGRVLAAELIAIALVQSPMTFLTAIALDRADMDPRTLAVVIGLLLWIPATLWYLFARPLFKGPTSPSQRPSSRSPKTARRQIAGQPPKNPSAPLAPGDDYPNRFCVPAIDWMHGYRW